MCRRASLLLPALLLIGCFGSPAGPSKGGSVARPSVKPAAVVDAKGAAADGGAPIVGTNAGRLVGKVRGPAASIVSDLGGSILSNNGGNIISDSGGGVVGKTKLRLLAASALVAVAGAEVTAVDESGTILAGPVRTGVDGAYDLGGFAPSKSVVFVRATYSAGGQSLTLLAMAPAPREAGELEVPLDPAATLVAKHVQAEIAKGRVSIERVDPAAAKIAARRLAATLDDALAVAAAVLPAGAASRALDGLIARDTALAEAVSAATSSTAGAPAPVPSAPGSTAPSTAPSATPSPRQARIRTLAGDGTAASAGDGGVAAVARVLAPSMLAIGPAGDLYFSEPLASRVRRISADGTIATIAGTGTRGSSGDGGPAVAAQLDTPQGLVVNRGGHLFIADFAAHRVRSVVAGTIRTHAGNGVEGVEGDGGEPTVAQLQAPWGLAMQAEGGTLDQAGTVAISNATRWDVRRVDASFNQMFKTRVEAFGGEAFKPGSAGPDMTRDLAIFGQSPNAWYLADIANDRILRVDSGIATPFAGTGEAGEGGDGGPALSAKLRDPVGLHVDAAGNVYIADTGNHRVRKVDVRTGIITTIAGTGTAGAAGDGGPPEAAQLSSPSDVVVGADGRIYISDTGNHRIRVIDPP